MWWESEAQSSPPFWPLCSRLVARKLLRRTWVGRARAFIHTLIVLGLGRNREYRVRV